MCSSTVPAEEQSEVRAEAIAVSEALVKGGATQVRRGEGSGGDGSEGMQAGCLGISGIWWRGVAGTKSGYWGRRDRPVGSRHMRLIINNELRDAP